MRATRGLTTPYLPRLEEADRRLAALDATEAFPPLGGAPVIERRPRPGRALAGALIALFGCAAWVGAVVLFIFRGVGHDARLGRAPRALWTVVLPAVFLVGFALFLGGLRFG